MSRRGSSIAAARRRPRQRARVMRSAGRGLALMLLFAAHAAVGADCTVSTQGVSFGGYDPFAIQDLDGTGAVDVNCDAATPISVALSAGSGSYGVRAMHAGAHVLNYNLYTDASYTTVWGDGSGVTSAVSGNGISVSLPVYGRIPSGQNAHVGSYSDVIVVTLTF